MCVTGANLPPEMTTTEGTALGGEVWLTNSGKVVARTNEIRQSSLVLHTDATVISPRGSTHAHTHAHTRTHSYA